MSSPDVVITREKKIIINIRISVHCGTHVYDIQYVQRQNSNEFFFGYFRVEAKFLSVYRHLRRKLSAMRGEKNRTNCVRKSPNETKDEKYFFGNRKPRRKKKQTRNWSDIFWVFFVCLRPTFRVYIYCPKNRIITYDALCI